MTSPIPNPLAFATTVTDTEPVFTATTTQVRFDVTPDIQAFLTGTPNYGWIVKGNDSLFSGQFAGATKPRAAPRRTFA